MATDSYGSGKVGMKSVELKGFTGVVSGLARSTHTETTVDHDRRTVTTNTSRWVDFTLTMADGSSADVNARADQARVANGDTATVFWGEVNGKSRAYYLAYYNHGTGALGYSAHERNDLAGPPGHSYIAIVAVCLAVFGVMGLFRGGPDFASFVSTALGAGYFYLLYDRRKKLRSLVEAAVASMRASGVKAPAAA